MHQFQSDRLVSVRDTAAQLGCSVATVWRRTSDGTLPQPVRIGGMTRWRQSDIANFIAQPEASGVAA